MPPSFIKFCRYILFVVGCLAGYTGLTCLNWNADGFTVEWFNRMANFFLLIKLMDLRRSHFWVFGIGSFLVKKPFYNILLVLIGLVLYQLFAPNLFCSIILFLGNALITYKARIISIEDIFIQNLLFHAASAGVIHYIGGGHLLSVVFSSFYLTIFIQFASAGFEKLGSPYWVKGNAMRLFFNLPQLMRWEWPAQLLKKNKWSFFVGWAVIIIQLALLPVLFYPSGLKLGFVGMICLAVSWLFVADLFLIGLIIITVGLFGFYLPVEVQIWRPDNNYEILGGMFFAGILLATLLDLFFYQQVKRFNQFLRAINGVNGPLGMFTSNHLGDFFVFRLSWDNKNVQPLGKSPKWDGYFWRPRYLYSAGYILTQDILLMVKSGKTSGHYRTKDFLRCFVSGNQKTVTLHGKFHFFDDTLTDFRSSRWEKMGVAIIDEALDSVDFRYDPDFEKKWAKK